MEHPFKTPQYNSSMVSVVQLASRRTGAAALARSPKGSRPPSARCWREALAFAEPLYAGQTLSTGEPVWPHALGIAAGLASIGVDPVARAAGHPVRRAQVPRRPGAARQALRLRSRRARRRRGEAVPPARADARLGRRAERDPAQDGARHGRGHPRGADPARLAHADAALVCEESRLRDGSRKAYARESLDIYSPLANRLGVWQLKWELEDLSFRYLEPELYKKIAQMLDEKRVERERYIANAIELLRARAEEVGREGRDHRAAQAHLFHLEQDAR